MLHEDQEIKVTFQKDYYSEDDYKIHRVVIDQDGSIYDYWRSSSTSWPSPVKGQKINCKVKKIYASGVVRLEELNEEYWKIGEFEKGQTLELEFFEDYTNIKGERHRVLIDHIGR